MTNQLNRINDGIVNRLGFLLQGRRRVLNDFVCTPTAEQTYVTLKTAAEQALENRTKSKKQKASRQEGLFKQVYKTLGLLTDNPRHPGLQTHAYDAIESLPASARVAARKRACNLDLI